MAWALVGAFLCGSFLGFMCLSGEERLGGLNLGKSGLGGGGGGGRAGLTWPAPSIRPGAIVPGWEGAIESREGEAGRQAGGLMNSASLTI